MCIIIIKQKGLQLPKDIAKNSARINPHGLGIIWLDTFEVSYHKSGEFKKLETERPFIAHFRYATVGAIGRDNTHPFQCGENGNEWLMMNGTIKGLGDVHTCDSKVLAQSIGKVARHTWKKELSKYDSRFVTINTRNKTYQVYNKELWTVKGGIWYSKDNVIQDNMVAVYGTLKKGYHNYWSYLDKAKYMGKGSTLDKYPLIINGLPYLIDEVDKGHKVEVDVFAVSDSKLRELDRLEGHPNWYQRRQVAINVKGQILTCWVYFNIKEKVKRGSVLHKSYTQNYKADKPWWEYEMPTTKYKPLSRFNDDIFIDEEFYSVTDEKPMCIGCYHDLEHDAFANYHCCGCGTWFTESEVAAWRGR
jgi:gamma-glutamylaminecyclotransferase